MLSGYLQFSLFSPPKNIYNFSTMTRIRIILINCIRQTGSDLENSWIVAFLYSYLEHPLANTFMASSIFIVICLTLDRFASVCLPRKFKSLHTSTNSRWLLFHCHPYLQSPLSVEATLFRPSKRNGRRWGLYKGGWANPSLTHGLLLFRGKLRRNVGTRLESLSYTGRSYRSLPPCDHTGWTELFNYLEISSNHGNETRNSARRRWPPILPNLLPC
jgi:hypothetical protein